MPPRRFVALAAAVGAATSVVVTWPLPLHLGSAVLEDGTYDAFQFLWNVWWVGESLARLHQNPFHTTYLFHPEGVPLLLHTSVFSLGLLALPLQAACGLVPAYNLLVMAAPALTLVLVALLARDVTGDSFAAVAAGLAAAITPAAMWFLPVLNLGSAYLIAALLLAWRRLQRTRRGRDVALALAVLGALVFAHHEYAVMGLALVALDTLCRVAAPRALGAGAAWLAGTLAFWVASALGLAGLAWAARATPAVAPSAAFVLFGSGYAAGLVTPPWLVAPPGPFWTVIYLGTAPLLLLPAALLWGGRRLAYWGLAAFAMAAMALGPSLHLHYPLGGAPPAAPAWAPPGPYAAAAWLLPALRFSRAPFRWVVAAEIALAVVAATGIAGLRARVGGGARRRVVSAAVLAVVVAGAALDVRGLRAPLAPAAIPDGYEALRDDPTPAAVLDLPAGSTAGGFAAFSSLYMFYQTAHRKFLLDGTVARLPPAARKVHTRHITDFAALPYVKWVVVHRDLLPRATPASREQAAALETLAASQGELVTARGALRIYRLHTFRPNAADPRSGEAGAPSQRL